MGRAGILPTDKGGAILIGLGVLIAATQLYDAGPVFVHVCTMCLILVAAGSGIVVVGRRRHRQMQEEVEETRKRGFAGRKMVPLGDQIATVIGHCSATLLISSILGGLAWHFLLVPGFLGVGAYTTLRTSVFWLIVLGSTSAVGWWTWRRLQEQNRKFCEPVCPQCGYVLYGVQERRCPDCGRPFELTELNVNLLRIDEEGRLQPKETRT